jgi:hypothetical protein
MFSKKIGEQVTVKGTVVNALTTVDGMVIVLMDLDGNCIGVHTKEVCVRRHICLKVCSDVCREQLWTLLCPIASDDGLRWKCLRTCVIFYSLRPLLILNM